MNAKIADACSLLASALVTGVAAAQDAPCVFNCSGSDGAPVVSDAIYCAGSDPVAGIAACTRLIEAAAQAGNSGALANALANRAKHHVLRNEPDLSHADIDEALVHVAALSASAAPGPTAFEPNDTYAQAKPVNPSGFGIIGYTPMPAHLTISAGFHDGTDTSDWYVVTPRDGGLSGTNSEHPDYCPSPLLHVRDRLEISIDAMGSGGSYDLQVSSVGPQPYLGEYVMQLGTSLPIAASGAPGEPIAIDLIGPACRINARALWIEVRRAESASAAAEPYTLELSFARVPNEPVISGIAPLSGPVGTAVTITGSDLQPFVEFNGVRAATTAVSATSITATVPSAATTGPIRTSDAQGGSDVSEQIFAVTNQGEDERSSRPPGRSADSPPPLTTNASGAGSLPAARDIACCRVVPNALQGRLGRVIVEFPGGAAAGSTRVVLLKEGEELQSGYGSQSWDLLPGTYDITISGKSVPNVTVQPRYDTNVRVGVLRISAGGQTRVAVLDAGKELTTGYGEQFIGLPIGSFALQVAGQTEPVAINEGQITDF